MPMWRVRISSLNHSRGTVVDGWLEVTLKLGNAINRGHRSLDGAVGVAISALLKLSNTKVSPQI